MEHVIIIFLLFLLFNLVCDICFHFLFKYHRNSSKNLRITLVVVNKTHRVFYRTAVDTTEQPESKGAKGGRDQNGTNFVGNLPSYTWSLILKLDFSKLGLLIIVCDLFWVSYTSLIAHSLVRLTLEILIDLSCVKISIWCVLSFSFIPCQDLWKIHFLSICLYLS